MDGSCSISNSCSSSGTYSGRRSRTRLVIVVVYVRTSSSNSCSSGTYSSRRSSTRLVIVVVSVRLVVEVMDGSCSISIVVIVVVVVVPIVVEEVVLDL